MRQGTRSQRVTGYRLSTDLHGTSLLLKFTPTVFLQPELVIRLSILLNRGMGRKATETMVKSQVDLPFKPQHKREI